MGCSCATGTARRETQTTLQVSTRPSKSIFGRSLGVSGISSDELLSEEEVGGLPCPDLANLGRQESHGTQCTEPSATMLAARLQLLTMKGRVTRVFDSPTDDIPPELASPPVVSTALRTRITEWKRTLPARRSLPQRTAQPIQAETVGSWNWSIVDVSDSSSSSERSLASHTSYGSADSMSESVWLSREESGQPLRLRDASQLDRLQQALIAEGGGRARQFDDRSSNSSTASPMGRFRSGGFPPSVLSTPRHCMSLQLSLSQHSRPSSRQSSPSAAADNMLTKSPSSLARRPYSARLAPCSPRAVPVVRTQVCSANGSRSVRSPQLETTSLSQRSSLCTEGLAEAMDLISAYSPSSAAHRRATGGTQATHTTRRTNSTWGTHLTVENLPRSARESLRSARQSLEGQQLGRNSIGGCELVPSPLLVPSVPAFGQIATTRGGSGSGPVQAWGSA
eukprot:TRINITY_DN3897_c0_g1_i1.p1 TRINITY_DN3897_c0_g1~~TRINITY_DN3897_c0_g1_i1.p1  ORF type:complete len:452 (+),score=67.58 TRINITY_DN3897_c0_g1_i1:102-1457(+)